MTERKLTRITDGWRLPFGGLEVSQLRIDHTLTLRLGPDAWITIETPAHLKRAGETLPSTASPTHIDPGTQNVGPALALFGASLVSALAFDDGRLVLDFAGGARLLAGPDPDYEAWNVGDAEGLKIVSLPGGELAIWS
ncbi:MAG: DUF6188 family protein [Streptomyces sp.]